MTLVGDTPLAGSPQETADTPSAARPMIGFGEVRHTRLRPAHHAFAYAGYFLLLPMRSMQDPAHAASKTCLTRNRFAPLSFFDTDHGDRRGMDTGGALAWLDALLHTQGITDATGEAWLQCYPRVFGYAFKPVSFWFCHRPPDQDGGALRAIVVEVNNTFGERHCYVLDQPRWGDRLDADKQFHVSPILHVRGQYHFRFMRTRRAEGERSVARIDYDDGQGAMLQTSVSGALEPLTPASMRKALWRYPAMTLGVISRIHLQAARLWLKRVGFTSKPAAPAVAVTRQTHPPA
jgi:uncharacterized protein